MTAYIGNGDFVVPLVIDIDPAQVVVPTEYSVTLVAGTESDILATGGSFLLTGPFFFNTTAKIYDATMPGIATVDVPIPDDPDLVGGITCFQWWVFDGDDVKTSEIVGVYARAAVWVPPGMDAFFGVQSSASSSSSSSGGRGGPSTSQAQRKRAFVRWMISAGAQPLGGASRLMLDILLGR